MKCGTKQKPRFTAIHAITLPENIRKNMLQFHALTGCDSTSQFTGIGKRSAWGIFCNNNNSELLYELGGDHTLNTPAMARVEESVCRLYARHLDHQHTGTQNCHVQNVKESTGIIAPNP